MLGWCYTGVVAGGGGSGGGERWGSSGGAGSAGVVVDDDDVDVHADAHADVEAAAADDDRAYYYKQPCFHDHGCHPQLWLVRYYVTDARHHCNNVKYHKHHIWSCCFLVKTTLNLKLPIVSETASVLRSWRVLHQLRAKLCPGQSVIAVGAVYALTV